MHTVVEFAVDGEHSSWHAKASKDIPQNGSVDGVVCFGEVDKAQEQGGVLPRQFLQSSYYEHHVNSRALGSEPTLFLRQNVLAFAIVTQTTRDDFEEYCYGVSHEGDATIIATPSPIFLLIKHLNRCIFPLLRHATSPPHSEDDIVELSETVQFFFVGHKLQELGRETVGPYRLSVCQRLLYFVPRRDMVRWSARGPLLGFVHIARASGWRLVVSCSIFRQPLPHLLSPQLLMLSTASFLHTVELLVYL